MRSSTNEDSRKLSSGSPWNQRAPREHDPAGDLLVQALELAGPDNGLTEPGQRRVGLVWPRGEIVQCDRPHCLELEFWDPRGTGRLQRPRRLGSPAGGPVVGLGQHETKPRLELFVAGKQCGVEGFLGGHVDPLDIGRGLGDLRRHKGGVVERGGLLEDIAALGAEIGLAPVGRQGGPVTAGGPGGVAETAD